MPLGEQPDCRDTAWEEKKGEEKKKLIVLDVNGLLLYRKFRARSLPPMYRAPDAVVGEFTIFVRPDARAFVQWCSERFEVVVWGTALKQNLEPLIPLVFQSDSPPVAVLSQSDCTETGLEHPEKKGKALLVKDLRKVWEHPGVQARGTFDSCSTLLVDDAPYKAAWNPAYTSIHPREWNPYELDSSSSHEALGAAGDIRRFLLGYAAAQDGREAVQAWRGGKTWSTIEDDRLCQYLRMAAH